MSCPASSGQAERWLGELWAAPPSPYDMQTGFAGSIEESGGDYAWDSSWDWGYSTDWGGHGGSCYPYACDMHSRSK